MKTIQVSLLFGFVALSGCATREPEAVVDFVRALPKDNSVSVSLQWLTNPTEYYTPRGQMTAISITEGTRVVNIPSEAISDIQDIWPERIELASNQPGYYELRIPSGVGEGSLDVYRTENFTFSARLSHPTLDYTELKKKPNKSEMATPRKPSD